MFLADGLKLCKRTVIDFRFTMHEALLIKPNMPTGLRRIPAQYRASTSSLLSVSSVPSGVRIKNASQLQEDHSAGAKYSRITQRMERFKKQYQLPVDNDFDNPLIYLASTDSIPVCRKTRKLCIADINYYRRNRRTTSANIRAF